GGIEHELMQVTLRGDVSIQRHRRESEGTRHSLHRDRIEPLGVRDLHGRLDDPLMTQLALRSSLRCRSDSPRHRDHPRHFLLGMRSPLCDELDATQYCAWTAWRAY